MKHRIITLLLAVIGLTAAAEAKASHGTLEYSRPASWWNEALPLGNGRLGAMVWGGPVLDEIQLNEENIWSGRPNSNVNPAAAQYVAHIRELIYQGKYSEAQFFADRNFMPSNNGGWNSGMKYQTFGSLMICFPEHSSYTGYHRELSLSDAVAVLTYSCGGVNYKRETFSSFADNVVITSLTADKAESLNFTVFYKSPFMEAKGSRAVIDGDELVLEGTGQDLEGVKGGIKFQGRTKIVTEGGTMTAKDGAITVNGASTATIYVSIATNFVNYQDISADASARAREYLAKAINKPYAQAKEEHIDIFRSYMDRMSIDLGTSSDRRDTDVRISDFKNTLDPALVATYFNFGRYLLISCSQEGGQVANLQGIWNDSLNPSWDSKYTVNINTEMNYWPSETCNLSELNEPLFRMLSELHKTGTKTAKLLYDVDGWVLHHNTDIWRITGPVDKSSSGLWVGGAGWLCMHLWEHYLFTGDKVFLNNVYPIMKDAALFYDQYMTYEPEHGWLVACPSNSPENGFTAPNGNRGTITAGCTMDNQIISSLWMSIISASHILGTDSDYAARLGERLGEMAPMQIGRWGQLQEWMFDVDNPKDNHRHVSHLWGLFPGNLISPFRTPELTQAAETSLIARGDPSTGWSMGWKVCLWARLLDGEHALKLITDQLTLVTPESTGGGTYPNMFDAHRPFQIDGNFGCTAGIAEMLMQSHDGFINILPALPSSWKKGSVQGLVARGGFEISISWNNSEVERIEIYSRNGGVCRLHSSSALKAKGLKKAASTCKNPLLEVPETPKFIANGPTTSFEAPRGFTYDLNTIKSGTYVIYKK